MIHNLILVYGIQHRDSYMCVCVYIVVLRVCSFVSDSLHPMDCSPPGSSVNGIFQARILEWVLFPTSGDLPNPGIELMSPALAGRVLTTSATWKAPEEIEKLIK